MTNRQANKGGVQMTIKGRYYEEFQPGQAFGSDCRTITEADHVNFTTTFGFFEYRIKRMIKTKDD